MKLKQALFHKPDVSICQVDTGSEDYDFGATFMEWDVEPIDAEILAAEYVPSGILDGYFILSAIFISREGEIQPCYVGVSMPERVSGHVFFEAESKIVEGDHFSRKGKVIPKVAIDGFGNYELFYSKKSPEIGLKVLGEGLKLAKRKRYIALDMAYILRDEKRYREAVEAFGIVIREGADNEYPYLERAALLEKLGDAEGAAEDRKLADEMIRHRRRGV